MTDIGAAIGVIGRNIIIDCGTHEEALRLVDSVTFDTRATDTALREVKAAAWDAVAWLESGRTDQAEGDAATSSRLRAALEANRD